MSVRSAESLDEIEWRALQIVQLNALREALPERSTDEVMRLVSWENPHRYATSHRDPNSEVGRRFNEGNQYFNPLVAIASVFDEPIGFMYGAENVSGGSEIARWAKRNIFGKSYFWIREVAVLPEYQGRGIASWLGSAMLNELKTGRDLPIATYIHPGENPRLKPVLEEFGFYETGSQPVDLYMSGSEEGMVDQVRMQHDSQHGLSKSLKSQ